MIKLVSFKMVTATIGGLAKVAFLPLFNMGLPKTASLMGIE
jgi:hypothetical protein